MLEILAQKVHNFAMVSLKKALPGDLEGVLRLCRRVTYSLEQAGNDVYSYGYPADEHFANDIGEGRAYLIKDKGRIVAYLSYDRDLVGSFFPAAGDAESKVYDLLEECGYKGEGYIVLHRFMVDPSYQRKGYGRMLLNDFMSRLKGNLLLLCVYYKSLPALRFYKALHFKNHGIWPFDYGKDYPGKEYLVSKYL